MYYFSWIWLDLMVREQVIKEVVLRSMEGGRGG